MCVLALLTACIAPRDSDRGEPPLPAIALAARSPPPPNQSGFQRFEGDVTGRVRRTAAWIDRFLSDERSIEEENRSWASLRLDPLWDEGQGLDPAVRARVRLVLPRTEERIHLAFDEDLDVEGKETTPPTTEEPVGGTSRQPERESLALHVVLESNPRNHVRMEVGARFHDAEPDPYAGARWRHAFPVGLWHLRAIERLRAYADDGLESVTTLDLDRPPGEELLFRATSLAKWREQEPGVALGERLALFQRLDESFVFSYEWDNAWVTEPACVLDESAIRLRAAERLRNGSLLIEVAPQIAWRHDADYKPSYGVFFRVELLFGREE